MNLIPRSFARKCLFYFYFFILRLIQSAQCERNCLSGNEDSVLVIDGHPQSVRTPKLTALTLLAPLVNILHPQWSSLWLCYEKPSILHRPKTNEEVPHKHTWLRCAFKGLRWYKCVWFLALICSHSVNKAITYNTSMQFPTNELLLVSIVAHNVPGIMTLSFYILGANTGVCVSSNASGCDDLFHTFIQEPIYLNSSHCFVSQSSTESQRRVLAFLRLCDQRMSLVHASPCVPLPHHYELWAGLWRRGLGSDPHTTTAHAWKGTSLPLTLFVNEWMNACCCKHSGLS